MSKSDAIAPSADPTLAGAVNPKALAALLGAWQPATSKAPEAALPLSAKKPKRSLLADFDPAAKPFSSGDKASDKAAVEALALEIDALQKGLAVWTHEGLETLYRMQEQWMARCPVGKTFRDLGDTSTGAP